MSEQAPIVLRPLYVRSAWGAFFLFAAVGGALLARSGSDFPNLHLVLDASMVLLSGLLAALLWDLGCRLGRFFPRWLAISFATTALFELIHILATVEWSGALTPLAQSRPRWGPITWPLAAHLLPSGIGAAFWLKRRGAKATWGLAIFLLGLGIVLFPVFRWLTPNGEPGGLGIIGPTLAGVPFLWIAVGVAAWRQRAEERIVSLLPLFAGALLLANVTMLFSRSPHDAIALAAHWGNVCGCLGLLLALSPMAASDIREQNRGEGAWREARDQLEARVPSRTAELAQANEHLRASEARMAGIVNSAMDAIISVNAQQQVILFNAAAEKMFRCSADEAMGRSIATFIPERFREQHRAHVSGFGRTGVTSRSMRALGALSGLRADGEEFPIEASISQVETDGQKIFTVILRDITERTRAEASIQESEGRLQTVVENLTEGLVIADLKGNLIHWNRAGLEMHGFRSLEEGLRHLPEFARIFELASLDGEVIPVEQWPLPRIIRGESLRNVETRVRRLDSDWSRVFRYSGAIVREATGEHVAFLSVTDITEQQIAEEQLTASLKEIGDLKAALDEHAIVAITDAQGRITFVNDKFCAISQYTRAELLGQDHRIINSGHHPKEFIRDLWHTIAHGRVWHGEIKNRAKDGTFYWVETTIVPFLNADGKPRQYVAIRADITERKRAEETLTASFREIADLKAALDEHAIVAITDPRGKISYVNDKFCAISRYSREELLGQDHRIINSGHHPKEFIRDLWHTIARGQVWHGEIKNRAKDGTFYWVETTIVPFVDANGGPRQYVAIRADITKRKQAEEALRYANESLELKVAERTTELLTAKELAESADRMKSEFLAAMSHELRTPLNGILGFTELLNDEKPGPLNAKQKQYASQVLGSGRHLLQLINDVLDLSKVEAGRMEVHWEAFALADALEEVCASTAPLAEKKRITLQRDAAHAPKRVTLDRKKTKQILFNLLSNAIKFTPDGGHVSVVATALAPSAVQIQVKDTGIGIKAQDLGKLFIEFHQIASGETRRQQGTGLGLALTKKLVELQGGTIAVASAPGVGSTFTATFPLEEKALPP